MDLAAAMAVDQVILCPPKTQLPISCFINAFLLYAVFANFCLSSWNVGIAGFVWMRAEKGENDDGEQRGDQGVRLLPPEPERVLGTFRVR